MNTRRRKNLQPSPDETPHPRRAPQPGVRRPAQLPTTTDAAWLFADFLAAAMCLAPENLTNFE